MHKHYKLILWLNELPGLFALGCIRIAVWVIKLHSDSEKYVAGV